MNEITQWARDWGVPQNMMTDLFNRLQPPHIPKADGVKSESWVSSVLNIEAGEYGSRLWRNNIGATETESGGYLRYGLCNESSQINEKLKSSDYIGITPICINQNHVGSVLGIFTAVEVKKQAWKFNGKGRENAQLNYINLVKSCGGFAGFINDQQQFKGLIS
jgi:hypothetical protein